MSLIGVIGKMLIMEALKNGFGDKARIPQYQVLVLITQQELLMDGISPYILMET